MLKKIIKQNNRIATTLSGRIILWKLEKNVLIVGDDHDFIDFLALILEGEFQFNIIEVDEYDKTA